MNFNLTKPCQHCPFRTDIRPFLTKGRAAEICESMVGQQKTFQCHKTLDTKSPQHCAGALIMLESMGRSNQLMRIAERLGFYDRTKLDMNSPVFKHSWEFIKKQCPRS